MSVQQIAKGFAKSAPHYDVHAQVQMQCAQRLAAYIEANTRDLSDGQILEVGCGTGLVSQRLLEFFSADRCLFTDICPEMLEFCRIRLNTTKPQFAIQDIEQIQARRQYAMIVAAFVLQWMPQLSDTLEKMLAALQPHGKIFFSVPADGSFPEWRALCKQAGVTFTGNQLPDASQFRDFVKGRQDVRLSLYEENFPVSYRSLTEFLGSLKSIGAGTSLTAARLSIKEGRRLLSTSRARNSASFTATYKVIFGHLTYLPDTDKSDQ